MSGPPSLPSGIGEILGALAADARGRLKTATDRRTGERDAAALAAALAQLAEAGRAAGLSRLHTLVVKGERSATVSAARQDELLVVAVDPARGTANAEKALYAWSQGAEAIRASPPTLPARASGAPAATAALPHPSPARAAVATPLPAPAARRPARDPWAALRRSLVRGHLTEASAHRRELAAAPPVPGRAGAEPVAPAALDRAVQLLVQGVGTVLAGDGLGGARTLEPLAGEGQPNLTLRWLALYWSGRAALRSGSSAGARTHLKQALLVAKLLDLEAVSATQCVVAELLAHDGDHPRALACLAHARSGFQRLGSRWGLARAWLGEARVLVTLDREAEAAEAARQAWAAEPTWEEPPVFLARRSIARSDLDDAEATVRTVSGPLAERVRSLVAALREGVLAFGDATEFLRECEAPPSARSVRALERIAQAAPRFVPAREALAWTLLKMGRYGDASALFRALLGQPLSAADRASVMLGLGCVAHAEQAGKDSDSRLQAAIAAAAAGPEGANDAEAAALPDLSARSSAVAATSAVFSGQLSVFALPDVVEFLRSARRTGLLVCSSESGIGAVHFRDGRITGARTPGTPDVCELLAAEGKVSRAALAVLGPARDAGEPDHVLGAALVRDGLLDAGALQEALRRKAELAFHELVHWKDGEFVFNRESDGERAPHEADLDPQDVLLNVFRQMDEAARDGGALGAAR